MNLIRQWGRDVISRLLLSKRANAAGGAAVSLPLVVMLLTNMGLSPELATTVAGLIAALAGLFIHSQGTADAGKEAAKLQFENSLMALLTDLQKGGQLSGPMAQVLLNRLRGASALNGFDNDTVKTLGAVILAVEHHFGMDNKIHAKLTETLGPTLAPAVEAWLRSERDRLSKVAPTAG